MTRQLLAVLAASTVLTFGGITGAMAQQSNPCAPKNPCTVKSMQNPCAAKSQPEGAGSEKDSGDAVRKSLGAKDLADKFSVLSGG